MSLLQSFQVGRWFCVALILFGWESATAFTIQATMDGQPLGAPCEFSYAYPQSVVVSGIGGETGKSCKLAVQAGSEQWGGEFTFPQTLKEGDEVWMRLRIYVPSNFNMTTDTGFLKFFRVHTFVGASGSNVGYDDMLMSDGSKGFMWTFNYEGAASLKSLQNPASFIARDKWETLEVYVRFGSTPAAKGGLGRFRLWKAGALVWQVDDHVTMQSSADLADLIYLFSYWNGLAPQTQQLYVDDILITSNTPANRDSQGNPYIGVVGPVPMPLSSFQVK